jgi:hypothetical protein
MVGAVVAAGALVAAGAVVAAGAEVGAAGAVVGAWVAVGAQAARAVAPTAKKAPFKNLRRLILFFSIAYLSPSYNLSEYKIGLNQMVGGKVVFCGVL